MQYILRTDDLLITSYRLILVRISQNPFSSVKRRYRKRFTGLHGKEVDVNKKNKYSCFCFGLNATDNIRSNQFKRTWR